MKNKGIVEKWVHIVWVLVILAIISPTTANAQTLTDGDYEYEVLENGTAMITKYTGSATELTIPATLDGKTVTRIADYAFAVMVEVSPGYYEDASTVTSVRFPDTLSYIGNWNFYKLKNIHIPSSVTSIESRAFSTEYVESITVDENNTVYDSRNNCNAIIKEELDEETGTKKVELVLGCKNSIIPGTVTSIGPDSFSGCTFASVTIPSSVTEIGYCAFSGSGLTAVNLPYGVTSIGSCAFMDCKDLKTVVLQNSITTILSWAFQDCSNLESINIPDSVTTIGDEVFSGCTKLEEVVIPASVTSIGTGAFVDCSRIIVDANNTVYDSRNNCNAIIEKVGTDAYGDVVEDVLITGCKGSTIPSGVTMIGEKAFIYCKGLTTISIPDTVTYIGGSAFSHCSGLTSVTVPSSVTCIDDGAFNACNGLNSVTLPSSVEYIGEDAFADCSSSMTVFAEKNSYAEAWANENGFNVINNKEESETTETPTTEQAKEEQPTTETPTTEQAKEEQPTTESPTTEQVTTEQPTTETEVVSKPKEKGTVLTVASAKCKVKVISSDKKNPNVQYTGTINKKATTIKVPDTITVDGVEYKVTSIGNKALSGNKKVEKIIIGKNVKEVGKEAFKNCTKLKTVEMKSTSLSKIGANAFSGDKKLTRIVLKTTKLTKKSIGKNALKGTNKKLVIQVPKKKVSVYKKYFKDKGNKNVKVKK